MRVDEVHGQFQKPGQGGKPKRSREILEKELREGLSVLVVSHQGEIEAHWGGGERRQCLYF